jgi:hypothetical protein
VAISFWKRIPAWGYVSVVFLSIAITLAEGYPWLSIQENTYLDPGDSFSQMFSVTNQGYVPLTDVDVSCFPNFETDNHGIVRRNAFNFSEVAHYLGHAGTVTIPCFTIPKKLELGGKKLPGATLEVTVTYALYHVNLKRLRRSQHFAFSSVAAKDGSQHWVFLR